eukprot:3969811-Amphidinium_carterae.1
MDEESPRTGANPGCRHSCGVPCGQCRGGLLASKAVSTMPPLPPPVGVYRRAAEAARNFGRCSVRTT